jgi:Ca-activated chloride channel family protein
MNFAQPIWLIIGLLGCIGLALFFRYMRRKRLASLERFVAHQLIGRLTRNISTNRRRNKDLLLLLAVFCCFAALARPQYGFHWVDVQRKGIDLLFALDTSKSMLAEDIKPNRLKRAHLAILDFVRQLDGDRVGLLPFAGSSYLMCPLTLDYDAFEQSLAAVSTDLIPRGGTNIAGVIDQALEVLDNAANHKILIIVTDGENLEGDAVQAAEAAAKKGLTIHTVGVGTSRGELIPLGGSGGQGFVKDQSGNFVTSRLDDKSLTAVAEKSGGIYAPLGTAGEGLETIYQSKLALIPKDKLAERRHKLPIERFEWPLALAAILLVVEMLVGERKKPRTLSLAQAIRHRISRKNQALILILLLLPFGTRSFAAEGEDAYARGDYLEASEYYGKLLEKSPDDPLLHYNFGTAAYKNNMFDDAVESFTRALQSDNVDLQKKAYYNRGKSQYRKGLEMRQADPRGSADQWRQALASLQSVMELDPRDPDANHNREIIKKQLAELEEELKQQEQQENQQDGQQQTDRNGEQQDQSGAQQNGKSEGDKDQSPSVPPQPDEKPPENSAGDGPEKGERDGQPAATAGSDRQEESPEERSAQDAERRQLGKMTREEAERMLNALKQQEGELNFVPSARGTTEAQQGRDW